MTAALTGLPSVAPADLWAPHLPRLRLDRRLTWVEWAEAHGHITRGAWRYRGRWRADSFPLMADAMRLADRRWVHEVSVCGPTRGGKTHTFGLLMLARAVHEGREAMLMSSTFEKAESTLAELEELLAADRPDGRRLWAGRTGETHTRQYPSGAVLHLLGANSKAAPRGFSAELVLCSEADAYPDHLGGEAGPVAQAMGRSEAYKETRRIIRESTCSTPDGYIWRDIHAAGTLYRPFIPCPDCRMLQLLLPDTDDGLRPADPDDPLRGEGAGGVRWEGDTADDAQRTAYYRCWHCGHRVGAADWLRWIRTARWLGAPGPAVLAYWDRSDAAREPPALTPPDAETVRAGHIAFWWPALIVPWSSVGYEARDLWSARQAGADPQGVVNLRSALPYRPRVEVAGALEAASVQSRLNGIPRGVCPVGTERVTAFVDVGARRLHWAVTAWRPGAVGYVIDYGVQQVHGPDADYSSLTVEQQQAYELALAAALRVLAERWSPGWPVAESPATARLGLALVDMGYSRSTETVYRHCVGRIGWCAAKGWTGERGARERFVPLRPPAAAKRAGAAVAWRTDDGTMWAAGDRWFLRRPPDGRALVTADVDHWKIWVHEAFRLHRAPDAPQPAGSLSLYGSDPDVHVELARHITAEQQVERVDTAGRMYLIWERISRDNHWLDALVGCRVAAEVLGVRADDDVPTAGTTRPAPQPPQSETSAARQPVVPLVRPARPVRMSRDGFGGG